MNFDVGGSLFDGFEKRLGRTLTNIVAYLVWTTVVLFCLGVIWRTAIAIYNSISGAFPTVSVPALNVLTGFYVTALIGIAALLFSAFQYFIRQRRVPQRVVDQLAKLRKSAIDNILNGRITTPRELKTWETRENAWEKSVSEILDKHFPKAEVLGFESLGVIQPVAFPHAFNNEHSFELSMFAKRLSILEDIIRRHTR